MPTFVLPYQPNPETGRPPKDNRLHGNRLNGNTLLSLTKNRGNPELVRLPGNGFVVRTISYWVPLVYDESPVRRKDKPLTKAVPLIRSMPKGSNS